MEFCAGEEDGIVEIKKPLYFDKLSIRGFQKNGYDGGRDELFLLAVIRFKYKRWSVKCSLIEVIKRSQKDYEEKFAGVESLNLLDWKKILCN